MHVSRRIFFCGGAAVWTGTASGASRHIRYARDFGLVSHPSLDQQKALQAALDWLSSAGGTLVLENGAEYCHSDILIIRRGSIDGNGASLVSLSPNLSCFTIEGQGVRLENLSVLCAAVERTAHYHGCGILVRSASHFILDRVVVSGSACAGILLDDARSGSILNVMVKDTMADGLHLTNGCKWITVENYTGLRNGDDGFAIVSYDIKGKPSVRCQDVVARNIEICDGNARGVALVGAERISLMDIRVAKTACAGLYIVSESSWGTFGNRDVACHNIKLTNCVLRTGINQGAVHIQGRNGCTNDRIGPDIVSCTVDNVQLVGVTINGLGSGARAGIVVAGNVKNLLINYSPIKYGSVERPAVATDDVNIDRDGIYINERP